MSPHRSADAAPVSPYPFVVRQGAQQPTGTDNSPRGSNDQRSKKGRPRQRAERHPRQDEEPRFNIGPPRPMRPPQSNRGVRQVFRMAGRGYQEDRNGVPNYPPPSFQEAMTTPPVSVCSSTTSLALAPNSRPLAFPEMIQPRAIPEDHREDVEREQSPEDRSPVSENDLNFESSMFVVERNTVPVCNTDLPSGPELEKRVKTDWLRRRGVEFPGKGNDSSTKLIDGHIGGILSRGRSTLRLPLRIQIDPEPDVVEPSPPSAISPKKRFLSLSPLKTVFPSRSPVHQDRATLSAHPTPSSPYSSSRSLFFRSSTSLATSSFLRLPLLSSSGHGKSEPLSRQLFKGKERTKSPDDLNTWEVVEEEAYENVDEDGNEKPDHPKSLMSAVESFQAQAKRLDTGYSPTKLQILTFSDTARTKQYAPETPDTPRHIACSARFNQEAALKDWKGPSTAFIDRPVNRSRSPDVALKYANAETIPTSPIPSTHVFESSVATGPPLTCVRVRATPSPSQPAIGSSASSAVHPSPLHWTGLKENLNERAAAIYQIALDTPLPVTPQFYSSVDHSGSIAALNLDESPDSTLSAVMPDRLSPSPESHRIWDADSSSAPIVDPAHPSLPLPVSDPPPVIAHSATADQEPMTPSRHHYAGRPLPRPPPTTSRAGVVDSTYAPPADPRYNPDKIGGSLSTCPEGLLIDLEDTTLDTIPASESTTPTDDGFFQYPLQLQRSQGSTSSVNLLADSSSSFNIHSVQGISTPSRAISPTPVNTNDHESGRHPGFSELTDLDLLVSSIADADPNGSDYEVSPGHQRWPTEILNQRSEAPPGLGSPWERGPSASWSLFPGHKDSCGSQSKRQHLPHRAY
ncbi:hypothetical protein CPC08DRAFT_757314 [Agrocybe pediades]|nr:hypothetical protein CPC08DRAFT_757314 [Agrocybe pediades]